MITNPFDLSGKTALITGSSRGLGFSIAQGLGRAGAKIYLNGRNADALKKAVDVLCSEGIDAQFIIFDVTEPDIVTHAINRIESQDSVDILVNNAGIQYRQSLETFPWEEWQRIMTANSTSAFLVSKAVAQYMIPRKAGKIINMCSLMSELARPGITPYAASKGAIKMLTRGMCAEWAKYNIQVNGIGPGYFQTKMNTALSQDPAFTDWLCQRTPAGRWGKPDELSGTAVFLASGASSFVNGQILYVDGGISACI